QGEAPGVERDQRELETLPFTPEDVFARHADVVESDDAVLDGLEAHEAAAVDDFHARPRLLDDERGDLLARLAVDDGVRRPRHDDEEFGARPVGAPELLAVEDEV